MCTVSRKQPSPTMPSCHNLAGKGGGGGGGVIVCHNRTVWWRLVHLEAGRNLTSDHRNTPAADISA